MTHERPSTARPTDSRVLVMSLLALSAAVVVLSAAAAMWWIWQVLPETPLGPAMLAPWALLVGGAVVAAILWALASLVARPLGGSHPTPSEPRPTAGAAAAATTVAAGPPAAARPAAAPPGVPMALPDETLEALLEEMRDLNVNLLLTDSQRQLKRAALLEPQARRWAQQARADLADAHVGAARRHLAALLRVAPDAPEAAALQQQLEEALAAALRRDIADATGRAESLMSAGRFDAAEEVAKALCQTHPDSSEAAALAQRVVRERDRFVLEQRQRMYQQIQQHAGARHWRAALTAAREMVEAYPDAPETSAVKAQLPTLADNARIEDAREARDHIRDLISRRRFGEALEQAREAVHRFPDTAVAEELRKGMGRLEELAAEEPPEGPAQPPP